MKFRGVSPRRKEALRRHQRVRSQACATASRLEPLEARQLLAAVAVADSYDLIQDNLLNVSTSGVLANDVVASGNGLAVIANTAPANGSLVLNPGGTFTYIPNPGFFGPDSFGYTASDGQGNTASAAVALNVAAAPGQATVTAGTRLVSVNTSQSALLNGLLGNLLGGTALDLSVVDNNALAGGQVLGDDLARALQANLGLATTAQALTTDLTLTQLFAASADAAQAGGNTALATALDNLAVRVAGLNQTIRLGDLVRVVPNQGSFADADLNALDLVTGAVQLFNFRNVATTTAPVTITGGAIGLGGVINSVALSATVVEPPIFTVGGLGTTFNTAGIRLKLDLDLVDLTPGTAALNTALVGALGGLLPVNTTLTLGDLDLFATVASGSGTITAIDAISRAVTLQTTPGVANVYLGTIPDAVFGNRLVPINPATDLDFGTVGGLNVAVGGVVPINATTAIQARSTALGSAPLNGSLTFTPPYPETQVDASGAAFLSNLAATLATNLQVRTSGPLGVVLDPLVNAVILPAVRPLVAGALTPVLGSVLTGVADPALDALGIGIGQLIVTVGNVGQAVPPAANDDIASTPRGTPATIAVLGNDAAVAGDTIAIASVSQPANGVVVINADGTLTYVPNPNYIGPDTFTYTIAGNNGTSTATVSVSVTPVNGPPVAVPDAYAVASGGALVVAAPGVLGNDIDPDGNPLTAAVVSNPANGVLVLNPNGSFTYTPNPGFVGTDTFTYRAGDGAAFSAPAAVTISVAAAIAGPLAVADAYAAVEDTPLVVAVPGVLGNDVSPAGTPLTASLVSNPANGTVVLNPNGSFLFIPNPGFSGTDTFTYRAGDGTSFSAPVAVTISVAAINDPPIALPDAYAVVTGTPLVVAAPGVLGNDIDPDGNPLTAAVVSNPANGVLVLNPNGSFTYTPNPGFVGTDTFTYRAGDGAAFSAPAAVTISVAAAIAGPLAVADAYAAVEDTPLVVAVPGVLGNDVSPAGTPLVAVLAAGPANGVLVLNPNGSFTYTPNPGFSGTDTFTYRAGDGTSLSSPVAVTISVAAVNDAPIALPDSYSGPQGTPLVVPAPGVLGNDIDPDGNPLTAVLVVGPANGTLTLNPNGSFVFVPNPGFVGSDSFTYRASDGTALSVPITVSITVTPAAGTVGPQVLSVARFGFHNQPTSYVVRFSLDMDPTSASDAANYVLVSAGRDNRFGTRDDRRVVLGSASYDPATLSVTLNPIAPVSLNGRYQLTFRGTGSGALRGASGVLLDGNRDGIPGDDMTVQFDRSILLGRARTPQSQRVSLAQRIVLTRIKPLARNLFAAKARLLRSLLRS